MGVEINIRALQNKPGFNDHMVLLIGKSGSNYIIHDPGLPAYKFRRVSRQDFMRSWAYAGAHKMSLIAFSKEQ